MASNKGSVVGEYKITTKGEYGTGRCDKCKNSNLERYKKCVNCFSSSRPERTEENSATRNLPTNQSIQLVLDKSRFK